MTLSPPVVDALPTDVGSDDPARLAHILHPRYSAAMLLEARVNGLPVEAWCGYSWVPSRDPKKFPLCQRCKLLHERYDPRPLEYA